MSTASTTERPRVSATIRSSPQRGPASASTPRKAATASAVGPRRPAATACRSEEHTSELQSRLHLVCRLLLEKKKEINDLTKRPTDAEGEKYYTDHGQEYETPM